MNGITGTRLLFFVLALTLVSCSSKKNEAAEEEPITRIPVDIPTTTQSTDSTLNSDLLATDTNNDLQPVTTSTTTTSNTPVSATAQICLSGNNQTTSTTNTTSTLQPVCYDSNAPYRTDLELFNMGLGSFGSLDACVTYIRSTLNAYCTAVTADQESKMRAARMGLVRCFRRVLTQQNQFAQWQPEIRQNYNNNDGLLYLLLQLFSNNGSSTN